VVGYGLALQSLNLYNEYKGRKAENPGWRALLTTAFTNRQALFIAGGVLVLFAMALFSLSQFYAKQAEDKEAAGAGTPAGEPDAATGRLLFELATAPMRQLLAARDD
jgi:hypothetical protein